MFKNKLGEYRPGNYKTIYIPLVAGVFLVSIALLGGLLANSTTVFNLILGVGLIVIASSGYWQIKKKVVPGYPTLRGGCAVAFGLVFIVFFGVMGFGLIMSTLLNW
jgi:hypothetical protein